MSPITLPIAATGLTGGATDVATIGSGASVPPGVESVLEFNGLPLNVRGWQDTYLVTEIDGLADADIRDSRDVNPQAHGETAMNSYYGGRTIALTGRIRAHRLDKLRDMQQGLRQAFSDLTTEYPLIFSAGNPANDVMIWCKKHQSIAMRESQGGLDFARDFLVTLRASNPRILSRYTSFAQWQGGTLEGFGTNASVDRTNLIPNPSAETAVATNVFNSSSTGLTAASVVRDASWAKVGTQSNLYTVFRNDSSTLELRTHQTLNSTTVTPGRWYGARITARIPSGALPTALRCRIRWFAADGSTGLGITEGADTTVIAVATEYGLFVIGQAPASAVYPSVGLRIAQSAGGVTTEYRVQADAIALYDLGIDTPPRSGSLTLDGDVPAYFDGDTNEGILHRWAGDPHASVSERFTTTGLEENWVAEVGNGGASVRNGQMMVSYPTEVRMIRQKVGHKIDNGRVTLKFTTPSTISGGFGIIFRQKSSANHLLLQHLSGMLRFYTRRADVYTQIAASSTYNLAANTTYWLRATFNGNVLTGEIFLSDPSTGSPLPAATFATTLAGADATDFGSGISGDVGFRSDSAISDAYRFDDFRTEVLQSTGFNIHEIINNGNFLAQPQLQITGPIVNPRLDFIDAVSGSIYDSLKFAPGTTLAAGDTWYIDVAKKTLVDQNVVNKFQYLDIDSGWPELLPGKTIIQLAGTSMDYRTTTVVMWRHTWI